MEPSEDTGMIDHVQAAVKKWKGHATDAGVSKVGIRQVAQSLPQLQ
jgi:hypothetical protein